MQRMLEYYITHIIKWPTYCTQRPLNQAITQVPVFSKQFFKNSFDCLLTTRLIIVSVDPDHFASYISIQQVKGVNNQIHLSDHQVNCPRGAATYMFIFSCKFINYPTKS